MPSVITTSCDHSIPPGPVQAAAFSRTEYDVIGYKTYKFDSGMTTLLRNLIKSFNAKSVNEKEKFRILLTRLAQAKRHEQIEDKLLDLCIALEMVLLNDNQKDQLRKTFSLRGSWLIGTSKNRIELFEALEKLYDYRSSIAHSGSLMGSKSRLKEKTAREIASSYFPKFEGIGEAILRKVILKGVPNWKELILGLKNPK